MRRERGKKAGDVLYEMGLIRALPGWDVILGVEVSCINYHT